MSDHLRCSSVTIPQFRGQGQIWKDSALPHSGEGEMGPQVNLVKRGREGTAASYSAWVVGERTGAGKASYPGDRL